MAYFYSQAIFKSLLLDLKPLLGSIERLGPKDWDWLLDLFLGNHAFGKHGHRRGDREVMGKVQQRSKLYLLGLGF